jgi:tetratricopeptide (TPR) repeat protein
VGRPQALINEDLKRCDYAVFVLHDRWGTPTGGGYTSGTEEEWALAEALYKENTLRNIALFFKEVNPRQLRDPGKQLEAVLTFKKRIEEGKQYLFTQYETIEQFGDGIESHLAKWLRDHEGAASGLSVSSLVLGNTATITNLLGDTVTITNPASTSVAAAALGFGYWITEAIKLLEAETPDYAGTLFCAGKAVEVARSDIELAAARNVRGIAELRRGNLDAAIVAFTTTAERFSSSIDAERRYWEARALVNKGITLGAVGRTAEEMDVYDDVVARFGTASELPLREQVAKALVNKGVRLGELGRNQDAIAVYDHLLVLDNDRKVMSREQIAVALVNKGLQLEELGRNQDAIAVYDDLLSRFSAATVPELRIHATWARERVTSLGSHPLPASRLQPVRGSERSFEAGLPLQREKSPRSEWYVSYAWGDDRTPEGREREEIVDRLCEAAKSQGYSILSDKEVMNLGDSISDFMRRIGSGDRVIIILSDKYLRSPHCMFELSEVWRTSRQEGKAFLDRVRIYALQGANIFNPIDWANWAIYWKQEHDSLESRAREHGTFVLGELGNRRLMQMRNFYNQVSDILGTIADIVQPRTFEELDRYGFNDPPAS